MPSFPIKICLILIFNFFAFVSGAQSVDNIHLHLDKDIYLPGETIWFKAYLYNNNYPASISTNFYVGLYDEAGKLVEEKTYPIMDASCNGDFTLSDSIKDSTMRIRAFTKVNWLQDSASFFEKLIIIRTEENRINQHSVSEENSLNIQFFPESGNFVAGINNFLAFKASYLDDRAAIVTGVIKDELNNTVSDSIKTTSLGLGKIQFTPGKGHKYAAVWSDSNNKTYLTALPDVLNTGVVLHTELVENTVFYMVNKNSEDSALNNIHLLAQMGDAEMYKADLLIGGKIKLVNKFTVDSMPAGILQLTLFDINWQHVAQSILYINPHSQRLPSIENTEKSTVGKAKNIIEINLPDSGITNLSASIADVNFYQRSSNQTIKQNLLFKTLLNLNKTNSDELENGTSAIADLIMLTHKWKKLSWHSIINNKAPDDKPVDDYLSLTVNCKEKNRRLGQTDMLNIILNDKITGKQFFNLLPDNANTFQKDGLIFYDSAKVYFGIKNEKESLEYLSAYFTDNLKFAKSIFPIKNVSWRKAEVNNYQDDLIDSVLNHKPKRFNEKQTLKGIAVKSRFVNPATIRLIELDNKYTTGMFRGIVRGYQFNLLDDKNANSSSDVLNYIIYRAGGLKICTGAFGERFLVNTRGINSNSCVNKVITFVDEVELPDQEGLANIPVSQIAYIKYVPGIVIGSSFLSSDGALYVYRKKGDELDPSTASMKSVSVKGYNLPKYFTNPDYSQKASLLQQDYRTTLYWNPYLSAEKGSKKIIIEYYNNDISKTLLLIVEGIDAVGNLVRMEKVIEN